VWYDVADELSAGPEECRACVSRGGVVVAEAVATDVVGESPQVAKSCMLLPRARNMELAFFLRDELEGGVESSFRCSVTRSVDELFAFRIGDGDGGGLSVPGICKSGFKRWAICLMNFMIADLPLSPYNRPFLPSLEFCCTKICKVRITNSRLLFLLVGQICRSSLPRSAC
jgi:hypothetical protein